MIYHWGQGGMGLGGSAHSALQAQQSISLAFLLRAGLWRWVWPPSSLQVTPVLSTFPRKERLAINILTLFWQGESKAW